MAITEWEVEEAKGAEDPHGGTEILNGHRIDRMPGRLPGDARRLQVSAFWRRLHGGLGDSGGTGTHRRGSGQIRSVRLQPDPVRRTADGDTPVPDSRFFP